MSLDAPGNPPVFIDFPLPCQPVMTPKSKVHAPDSHASTLKLARFEPSIIGNTNMEPKNPLKPPTKKRPPTEFSTPARWSRNAPAANLIDLMVKIWEGRWKQWIFYQVAMDISMDISMGIYAYVIYICNI